jgi:hypothetical protein
MEKLMVRLSEKFGYMDLHTGIEYPGHPMHEVDEDVQRLFDDSRAWGRVRPWIQKMAEARGCPGAVQLDDLCRWVVEDLHRLRGLEK